MPSFSERMGLKAKKIMQIDTMDQELRTALHNAIRTFEELNGCHSNYSVDFVHLKPIYALMWTDFFNRDKDQILYLGENRIIQEVKKLWMKLPWNKSYDYCECYYELFPLMTKPNQAEDIRILEHSYNYELEKHNSAYRFCAGKFIPITNDIELESVADAAETGYENVDTHMINAIEAFSEKVNTNYEIVIHHAITAAEAAAGVASKSEGKSLNNYLNILKDNGDINSVMAEAFSKLYGYTCHKDTGIRHALCLDAKHPPKFEEAKYMLVTCSAFVNFMKQKFMK